MVICICIVENIAKIKVGIVIEASGPIALLK